MPMYGLAKFTIADEQGRPMPGESIEARWESEGRQCESIATTDADGVAIIATNAAQNPRQPTTITCTHRGETFHVRGGGGAQAHHAIGLKPGVKP